MINFRDFLPADTTPALALSRRYEAIGDVLARVNRWIDAAGAAVINVGTLLLPASAADKGSSRFTDNLQFDLGGIEIGGTRVQVVRVWYRDSEAR
jgi:hypothetical protein